MMRPNTGPRLMTIIPKPTQKPNLRMKMNQVKLPRRKKGEYSVPLTSNELGKLVSDFLVSGGTVKKGPLRHANGAYRGTLITGSPKKGK